MPHPDAPHCTRCKGPCKKWKPSRYPEEMYQRLTVLAVVWGLVLIVLWLVLVVPALLVWGD